MELVKISMGLATVILTSQECDLLAYACWASTAKLIAPHQEAELRFVETAGSAFYAASIATDLQNDIPPPRHRP